MDPVKCGAHEIHCIEQEAELAEARVRERVRTEAAEAERALDNAAHCASAEQKNVLAEEQTDKAQNTRPSSAKSPTPSDEQAALEAQNSANWKMTLVILTTASVLMSLSYTMLIPFLPMYLLEELHVAQEDVNLWSGLVFSVSFLISGVMAPIWGALADKRSKKMMAVRAAALLAISYGLGGIVQNEWQLLAMRAFQGFAAGLWPACLAILSSSVPKTKLGFALGTMQGGLTAGGVIGPLIGGILAEAFGMRSTFFLGAAALLTITVLIIFKIKDEFTAAEDQSASYSGCAANAHYCRRSADDDSFSAAHHAALCGGAPGEHGSHRARNRHSFFGGGSLWRLCVSGLGYCGTKMGVPTGALFRTSWHDDIRRDPGHSE